MAQELVIWDSRIDVNKRVIFENHTDNKKILLTVLNHGNDTNFRTTRIIEILLDKEKILNWLKKTI